MSEELIDLAADKQMRALALSVEQAALCADAEAILTECGLGDGLAQPPETPQ